MKFRFDTTSIIIVLKLIGLTPLHRVLIILTYKLRFTNIPPLQTNLIFSFYAQIYLQNKNTKRSLKK